MFKKNTEIISSKIKDLDKSINLSSYIGKKVYSKSGEIVGKISDVVIHNNCMNGVIVKGKKELFIDKAFFEEDSEDAVMLSIDPVINMIGKQVYDSEGKKIGKVVDVERKSNANAFTNIKVKDKVYSKPIIVPKKDIDTAKDSIMLNKSYD
jgi:sporulation protein YlmC with PRC-barrel domain